MTAVTEVVRGCGLPWMPVDGGAPPAGDAAGGWRRLGELWDPAVLAGLHRTVLAECDGRRDVATAFLAARFALLLARLAVIPVVRRQRALLFAPGQLWVRHDARGLFTAARVPDAALASEPCEPVPPGQAGAVVMSVHATASGLAVDGYRPVVSGLREVAALGERALWGQLADAVVAAVGHGVEGDDAERAGDHARRFLRAADPPLWVRPEFATVGRDPAGGGPAVLTWRRGSCCLAYRLAWSDLCTGCPLQSRSAWLSAAGAR